MSAIPTIVFNKFEPVYRFTGLVTNLKNLKTVAFVKTSVISQTKTAPAGGGGPSGMITRKTKHHSPEKQKPAEAGMPSGMLLYTNKFKGVANLIKPVETGSTPPNMF